jgi:hypothetical protein
MLKEGCNLNKEKYLPSAVRYSVFDILRFALKIGCVSLPVLLDFQSAKPNPPTSVGGCLVIISLFSVLS